MRLPVDLPFDPEMEIGPVLSRMREAVEQHVGVGLSPVDTLLVIVLIDDLVERIEHSIGILQGSISVPGDAE